MAEKQSRKEIGRGRHDGSRPMDTLVYSRLRSQHLLTFTCTCYIEASESLAIVAIHCERALEVATAAKQ